MPARNSHITLAFLGELGEFETEEVISATAATIAPVTGLALGAPAWLPRRRPRNLVLDIHDDRDELVSLQSDLALELKAVLGWSEDRPYRPHLTCGRTGRGFVPSGSSLPVSPSITFTAESISVYCSRLQPEGAEYEPLARFPAEAGSGESPT